MTRQRINLAFVGTGNWARRHHFPTLAVLTRTPPPELSVDVHLRGITSLEPVTARAVADRLGFERVYDNLDALLEDDDVTAIAVAVPPERARSVVARVAEKQVPLFSEKPPGISTAEAQALSEAVTVPNVLAFNRRFAPLNNTFKDIVEAMPGTYFVEGHFYRHERHDPAFMVGTGIHWINFITYCFGDIEDVTVERFRNPANETWNRVAHLTFKEGLRGLLKVFPCSGSQVERLEVHSATQSAYLEGPLDTHPGRIVLDRGATRDVIDPGEGQPEIVRIGIVGEYLEFFNCACAGLPTRSNFQNAVNAMRVAEAME